MKRSIEDWDDFAKKMKMEAEQKAEANKNLGEGMDIYYLNVVREIMAASFGDPDVKYDETVHEFVDGDWNEQNEYRYYDAISGEPLVIFSRRSEEVGDGYLQEAWSVRKGAHRRMLGKHWKKSYWSTLD